MEGADKVIWTEYSVLLDNFPMDGSLANIRFDQWADPGFTVQPIGHGLGSVGESPSGMALALHDDSVSVAIGRKRARDAELEEQSEEGHAIKQRKVLESQK